MFTITLHVRSYSRAGAYFNPSDAVLFEHLYTVTGDDAGTLPKTSFYKENSTNQWRIQNVEVKCDLITFDNALENSYSETFVKW